MRVLVVDDEAPARRKLRMMLGELPEVQVIGEADSGVSAVNAIRDLAPDVVFLDIQMPEGDGFDVVQAIGVSEMPLTVFVTAFDEHAVRAFEVEAIDYVLKPFTAERITATLGRLRARLAAPRAGRQESLERAVEQAKPARTPLRHLLVEHGNRSHFLPVERIDWLEADRNYVTVHAAGRAFTLRSTLNAFEERLDPARFLRINRSQVVRIDAVREVQDWSHGDRHMVMHDGARLVWSRRYRARDDGRFGIA